MAGRASRISNYCHTNPTSNGCPWPRYIQPVPPIPPVPPVNPCKNINPLSIGTTLCKQYVAYVNGTPYNQDNYITPRVPILGLYPEDISGSFLGFVTAETAPLFSDAKLTNQIGDLELTIRAIYDTPTNKYQYFGPANVTSNTTVNWFDISYNLKASLNTVYSYHLDDTTYGIGNPKTFSTIAISTGQQLFGQKVIIDSYIIPTSSTTFLNKLVFNLS